MRSRWTIPSRVAVTISRASRSACGAPTHVSVKRLARVS